MNPFTLILGLILVAIIIFALVYVYNKMSKNSPASGGNHGGRHSNHNNDNDNNPHPPHWHPSTIGGNPVTWSPSR